MEIKKCFGIMICIDTIYGKREYCAKHYDEYPSEEEIVKEINNWKDETFYHYKIKEVTVVTFLPCDNIPKKYLKFLSSDSK